LPNWFNDHPGLAAMKIAIPPLENWNFQPGGVSLRVRGQSQDVNAGRMGFALGSAVSRNTGTILVPTRSEMEKRLGGRLRAWGPRYADLIDKMMAGSVRRPMRNNREAVPVTAFDEQESKIAKLFAELVSELQRAPV
jgi:hypothetical protein